MPFRDDQLSKVREATDIVRLVGEHVALRPRGKEFLGLCPFHDDKNPSMHVSPVKQIYKCFSCGAGGSVFDFVMNYHKMAFPEALRFLADKAGIKLEDRRGHRDEQQEGPSDRELIASANAQAVTFFRALLRHPEHGRVAREYVEKRGISPEMIEAFQIGYAPDRWDGLAMMINEKGWNRKAFKLAGLISERQNGQGEYDRLRHRLIFPIFDAIGRPIAFGGRKLREEDEPKYLNSPETALFNKSATLYGLHLAKKPIIDSRTAVIVEGYTDVIACHQAGVRNVVATLGTALTMQHVQSLRHYCEKVVLVYDGDEAGQKAADRAVEIFFAGSLDVAFAVLPDELDPAELFEREDGIELWSQTIANATDALAFQFQRVRSELNGAETVTGRQRIAEDYLTKLAQLGLQQTPTIRKAWVLPRLSQLLHLPETQIQELLKRMAPARKPVAPAANIDNGSDNGNDKSGVDIASVEVTPKIRAIQQAERQILGALLRQPDLFHRTLSDGRTLDEAITPAEFLIGRHRDLYERIYQSLSDAETGTSFSMANLLADFASEGETELSALATEAETAVDALTDGQPDRTAELLSRAADALLAYHRENDYRQTRQALNVLDPSDADGETNQAQLLRRLAGDLKANPSKSRIMR